MRLNMFNQVTVTVKTVLGTLKLQAQSGLRANWKQKGQLGRDFPRRDLRQK